MVKEILLLGDPRLYKVSEEVDKSELEEIRTVIEDLHDTLMDFRKKWGYGRAIAAPQIGISKRILYMNIDKPVPMINPILTFPDDEMMEVLDDCMSFPNLFVKVMRHKRAKISYKDENWEDKVLELEGDLSELIQHEYDHLDGILAVMKAIDNKSLIMKK